MDKKEMNSKTIAELKRIAAKMEVKIPSKAKKSEIIDLLLSSERRLKPAATGVVKKAVREEIPTVKAPKAKKTVKIKKTPEVIKEEMPAPMPIAAKAGEEIVEAAKYYVGPVEEKFIPVEKREELPPFYGENKIVLMARDPYYAFTYWEVTSQRYEDAKRLLGQGVKLILRVYDITDIHFDGKNARGYFDIEVYEMTGSWYINIGRPNRSFCIDLGALAPDGRFLTLVRSNTVTMPRDTVSDVVDEEWMLLEEEFMKLFAISGGYGIGLSTLEIKELIKKRMHLLGISSPSSRWN
ncbi:MAG: DUF4912 domain-containing protein [Nitrospirae bacterium]|nr:DUF4912 domain-containing protein [Nitrospirota bacterium]